MKSIDELDRRILLELHENPVIKNKEIAKKLEVSEASVSIRIDNMLKNKVMKIAVQRNINHSSTPFTSLVDVSVGVGNVDDVAQAIAREDFVVSITMLVDEPQVVVLMMAKDAAHTQELVESKIGSLKGVRSAHITVCLDSLYIAPGIAAL